MKTVFLRAVEADDKAAALRTAITDPAAALGRIRFDVDTESFELGSGLIDQIQRMTAAAMQIAEK